MNYLNMPGLYNSGEAHWQTRWEKLYPAAFSRVQQQNWDMPYKNDWVQQLDKHIQKLDGPTVLIAHSLGCITTVHWLAENYSPFISGVLLVAPADVETSSKEYFKTFAPVPLTKINIPAIVVASIDDHYCAIHRAATWASHWQTRFVSVGYKGHINSDSNLQDWEEGLQLLRDLEYAAAGKQYRHAV